MAHKPFLDPWRAFFMSNHISQANLSAPYHTITLKGKTQSQKAGLRFEKNTFSALARMDFVNNLNNFLDYSSLPNNYLILHNPNFLYSLRSKQRLCIPDILIFVPKILNPIRSVFPNPPVNSIGRTLKSISLNSPVKSIFLDPFPNHPVDSISLSNYEFIICCEIKLTYVDIAIDKLKSLYLPVIHKAFNLPIIPLVIVKNLTKTSPKSSSILSSAIRLEIPLLNYFGSGNIY